MSTTTMTPITLTAPVAAGSSGAVLDHVHGFFPVLDALEREAPRIARWGEVLADTLTAGGRLLVAGNGGSAAEAQHLTAELVGRFDGDRRPFSAIALSSETSSVTAIGNDYGFDEVFARQVAGHARHDDVVLLLSTSGRSRNLIKAATTARDCGALCWAMTGDAPNRLALSCDDALCVPGPAPHVQEAQLIVIHALCRVFDACVAANGGTT